MHKSESLSIIVPVYNAEKTIIRCVKSLLMQKTKDIQIILVNDASVDSTCSILHQLEEIAPERILIIDLDRNGGPATARNVGLEYATGRYIGFADSDDYVATGAYDIVLAEAMSGDYDMVDFGYMDEDKDRALLLAGRDLRGTLNDNQRSELIAEGGYLWSRIYKRELIYDNDIRFRDGAYMLEDSEIMTELIARTKTLGAVEETLYWYSMSEGSLSKTWNYRRYVDSVDGAINALKNLQYRIDNYAGLRDAIEYEMIHMYDLGIYSALADYQRDRTMDTLTELNKLRDIRTACAGPNYENPYVKQRMTRDQIERMKANDKDPEALMSYVKTER